MEVIVVDKKKPTKKLGAQELEKRKAPFASPITYREGEGPAPAPTDTPRHDRQPVEPPERNLPKTPRYDRNL